MPVLDQERERWWAAMYSYNWWKRTAVMEQVDALCAERGIGYLDLSSPSRVASVVDARRQAARILRGQGIRLPVIGKILRRHHTTIMHLISEDGWVGRIGATLEVSHAHSCRSEQQETGGPQVA